MDLVCQVNVAQMHWNSISFESTSFLECMELQTWRWGRVCQESDKMEATSKKEEDFLRKEMRRRKCEVQEPEQVSLDSLSSRSLILVCEWHDSSWSSDIRWPCFHDINCRIILCNHESVTFAVNTEAAIIPEKVWRSISEHQDYFMSVATKLESM